MAGLKHALFSHPPPSRPRHVRALLFRRAQRYIQGIVPAGSIGVHLSLAIAINAQSSA